jgi:hypothetical protein
VKNPFADWDGRRHFSILAIIAMSIGGVALAAALALFFGWIVMLLWNWLMPSIFKLPVISYWQGWGLVLLSHILIKPGFGAGGRHMGGNRHGKDWKTKMKMRFDETDGSESQPDPAATV